ncbi:exopolysaccharide biosynthesis polyprenyl glycosylphosphotransferase [Psychroflexus torquis ATCC 700755]|uniref:Exopolysaccharide biosynthesis polyprenyl glycosylphosphotransferase n=2 Tax=Psychroflexus TaxID=83612 RepID=K4IDM3_PSYTT|nr:sugar transferase [Psychroflexus torquis]AFU68479.1 exopolysaccharide biosynthesis polyprenyl glycosylphosphotransferase [Psychroflexus torquis ATCC 700755]
MYELYFKRLFDWLFSFFMILILFIPFIIVSILIKIDSKGSIFFMQERLGKNKIPFNVYKLRTMSHKKRKIEQVYKNDAEITGVGYYLRRFKIDEMPQVINIFLGDMAIIGPRPCLPNVLEKYNLDDYRFKVRPGLSSIAGVNGSIYLSWKEKWWYDKYYVENLNFLLDLKIFLKTFLIIFQGEDKFINKPKL